MSLQDDLQTAVAKVTADSGLLHRIVHGDTATTVVTEGGPVKSVAKAIADVEGVSIARPSPSSMPPESCCAPSPRLRPIRRRRQSKRSPMTPSPALPIWLPDPVTR
ncbi:MAG: hypothetical protein EPN20_04255 [Magnetospirillum sp.]|nr:MAG: hypothetical protein EPN20_04255 [Magnetospirillum sp.]